MTNPNHSHHPTHTMDARHPRALFPALVPPDSRPTIGVLALQGDVREHSLALEASGARPVVVRRATDLGRSPGDRIDALVIPGGESTTMSTLLVAFGMLEPLRELIGAGLPAYGSCAGMIMLADRVEGAQEGQAFLGGIDMTVRRNAFGRQVDSYEEDLDVEGLDGGPFHAVFIRAPWVERVGDGVEVLATVPSGPASGAVVAVRSGRVLATSFHPECTGDARVHEMFLAMVSEAGYVHEV